ncbi:MAG: hypothetical protein AB1634_11045 [Thermodesulfobacteriota bacterium]
MKAFLRHPPLLFVPLVVSVLMLLGGCRESGQLGLRFSHFHHLEEQGLACADCHGPGQAGRFARAGHQACRECHSDWIDAEPSLDACGHCHLVAKAEDLAAPRSVPPAGSGVFLHTPALTAWCGECHGALLDRRVETLPPMTRNDVLAIRERSHAAGRACSDCHEGLSRETMPASHASTDWHRRHGLAAVDSESACRACHAEPTCRACHQEERPASHTALFTESTHGFEASWDRQRCRTCHQEDFCAGCHQETRPRSHTAAWQQQHCLACHDSFASCRLCHPGGIASHEGLTIAHIPQPFTCLVCHDPVTGLVPVARLNAARHPFLNEAECLACHRY